MDDLAGQTRDYVLDGGAGRPVGVLSEAGWELAARPFDLESRAHRARVYEIVLQEGRPADILAYVDGAVVA